ncbi:ef hand family protein [Stylonychia lemnae]|uniref:Ef hand family protein n=1 Tax=Stylonychia lemnae TaxID=5949 RepID=A0A078B708_STYLE|nr:ef hand family protein [Stylonychia lemnae]|eukprot:CDW89087.1 ef hand family protein [Stylonychia lemnae]
MIITRFHKSIEQLKYKEALKSIQQDVKTLEWKYYSGEVVQQRDNLSQVDNQSSISRNITVTNSKFDVGALKDFQQNTLSIIQEQNDKNNSIINSKKISRNQSILKPNPNTQGDLQSKLVNQELIINKKQDYQTLRENQEDKYLIKPLLRYQTPDKQGKKKFTLIKTQDLISHSKHDNSGFKKRNMLDFPNYSNQSQTLQSLETPETHPFYDDIYTKRLSQKKQAAFMSKIISTQSNYNPSTLRIIDQLHKSQVDFRRLLAVKTYLYNVLKNKDDIKVADFKNAVNSFAQGINESLIKEILTLIIMPKDIDLVDFYKFANLVEGYNLYPVRVQKQKNEPSDINLIAMKNDPIERKFSSSQKETILKEELYEKKMKLQLEFIWLKVSNKYPSLSSAFRYFDRNGDSQINFIEFSQALDSLGIQLSIDDQKEVYKYLDQDGDQTISFNEFCRITHTDGILQQQKDSSTSSGQVLLKVLEDTDSNPYSIQNQQKGQFDKSDIQDKRRQKYANYEKVCPLIVQKRHYVNDQQNKPYQMDSIIKHEYLNTLDRNKEEIQSQAEDLNYAKNRKLIKRSVQNRTQELRSKSVAKNINLKDQIDDIEVKKQHKANTNNMSFLDIQKSHRKILRNLYQTQTNQSLSKINNSTLSLTINNNINSKSHLPKINLLQKLDSYHQKIMNDQFDHYELNEQKNNHKQAFDSFDQVSVVSKKEKDDLLSNYFKDKRLIRKNQAKKDQQF